MSGPTWRSACRETQPTIWARAWAGRRRSWEGSGCVALVSCVSSAAGERSRFFLLLLLLLLMLLLLLLLLLLEVLVEAPMAGRG